MGRREFTAAKLPSLAHEDTQTNGDDYYNADYENGRTSVSAAPIGSNYFHSMPFYA
jgi:hypothetical protein